MVMVVGVCLCGALAVMLSSESAGGVDSIREEGRPPEPVVSPMVLLQRANSLVQHSVKNKASEKAAKAKLKRAASHVKQAQANLKKAVKLKQLAAKRAKAKRAKKKRLEMHQKMVARMAAQKMKLVTKAVRQQKKLARVAHVAQSAMAQAAKLIGNAKKHSSSALMLVSSIS